MSNVKNQAENVSSQELLKTPRSLRKIEQSPETIYKIEPMLWNNVPPIVYEAVAVIICALDNARGQIHTNYLKALSQYDESVTVRNEEQRKLKKDLERLDNKIWSTEKTLTK